MKKCFEALGMSISPGFFAGAFFPQQVSPHTVGGRAFQPANAFRRRSPFGLPGVVESSSILNVHLGAGQFSRPGAGGC